MLIYFLIIIIVIYLSEIGAYFWHRFGAHTNIIPPVRKMHDIHHEDIMDEAHGDFIYVCVLLFFFFLSLFSLYFYNLIDLSLFLSIYIPVLIVFVWNYYIHTAYHIEDHWLNEYEWFQNDKKLHFQHHKNPETNYGIATHFTDEILNTFDYGLIEIKYHQ
jgi:Fatty acid hydroxylase